MENPGTWKTDEILPGCDKSNLKAVVSESGWCLDPAHLLFQQVGGIYPSRPQSPPAKILRNELNVPDETW